MNLPDSAPRACDVVTPPSLHPWLQQKRASAAECRPMLPAMRRRRHPSARKCPEPAPPRPSANAAIGAKRACGDRLPLRLEATTPTEKHPCGPLVRHHAISGKRCCRIDHRRALHCGPLCWPRPPDPPAGWFSWFSSEGLFAPVPRHLSNRAFSCDFTSREDVFFFASGRLRRATGM
jgi:hypothetical protein